MTRALFPRDEYVAFVEQILADYCRDLDAKLLEYAPPIEELQDELRRGAGEPVRSVLSRGGKRSRPLLSMGVCELHGGDPFQADLVLAPELLHAASLVLDDVADCSDLRRGAPALHVEHGVDIAVNTGGLLVALALERIAEAAPALLELATYALVRAHLGQAADIATHAGRAGCRSVAAYLATAHLKTGVLFEFAVHYGAALAQAEPLEGLLAFAREAAVAFQILDDCLPWTAGGVRGKARDDDLREGKLGYPILRAMELLEPTEAAELSRLHAAAHRAERSQVQACRLRIEELVLATQAVDEGLQLAERELTAANQRCLSRHPQAKPLLDLVSQRLNRHRT